jgi:hypothetical protein
MRNGFDCCRNLEAAEIGAAKDVTSIRWSRDKTNVNRNSSVQSDSARFYGTAERSLFDQMPGPLCRSLLMLRSIAEQRLCRVKTPDFRDQCVARTPQRARAWRSSATLSDKKFHKKIEYTELLEYTQVNITRRDASFSACVCRKTVLSLHVLWLKET